MSAAEALLSQVRMPGAGSGLETIRWRTAPPGSRRGADTVPIVFWCLVSGMGASLPAYFLGSPLGLLCFPIVMVWLIFVSASTRDRDWESLVSPKSVLDIARPRQVWWRHSSPFTFRSGYGASGRLGPQSVVFALHYFRRISMFCRPQTRMRLDVAVSTRDVVAIMTCDAVEILPHISDFRRVGAMAATCELVRGRAGALVVVLPDRVHFDIPVRAKSDVASALTLALALPIQFGAMMEAHGSGSFREAPAVACDADVERARRLAGPAVTLPSLRIEAEAMLWPPPRPEEDD